tara:strand:+ start:335 stop:850 length:516 start_codon:yes stop_codon:yes gene_type:complete
MARQQNIYDKIAKYSKIQDKPKTALSKCKYDFSKKQVRLKNHNVKLSLIDDIKSEYEYLEEMVGIASYYGYERLEEITDKYDDFRTEVSIEVDNMAVNSGVSYVPEGIENLINLVGPLEVAAEALGISPNELYDGFDDAVQLINSGKETYSEFIDVYKEFVRTTGLVNDFL